MYIFIDTLGSKDKNERKLMINTKQNGCDGILYSRSVSDPLALGAFVSIGRSGDGRELRSCDAWEASEARLARYIAFSFGRYPR